MHLKITCMVKPSFHRCSLMVKVLCVWYNSWSGGSIFEPRFCKKHDFHKFSVFVKRHICGQKKSSSQEGYTLSTTSIMMPRFHRCSLMVKVLCVWYYSWSGGSIFEPRFCTNHDFHKFSVFLKRHILQSKKSSSREGYTLSNTCMVHPSSIDGKSGKSFMCMVLFLVRREHL